MRLTTTKRFERLHRRKPAADEHHPDAAWPRVSTHSPACHHHQPWDCLLCPATHHCHHCWNSRQSSLCLAWPIDAATAPAPLLSMEMMRRVQFEVLAWLFQPPDAPAVCDARASHAKRAAASQCSRPARHGSASACDRSARESREVPFHAKEKKDRRHEFTEMSKQLGCAQTNTEQENQ